MREWWPGARRGATLLALLLPLLVPGCTDPSTGPSPGDDDPEGNHTFTYTPPPGAPGVVSMSVRGSFNDWNVGSMAPQEDGSWERTVDLGDGDHSYKYFINGEWVGDMCHDEVWGDPDAGYLVDLHADGCLPDGYGGQNAVVVMGDVALSFRHHPTEPAHLSVAGGRLSVRFLARRGTVVGAVVVAGDDTIAAHAQLVTGLDELWRASIPDATPSYSIAVQVADSVAGHGPYQVPADLFRSVPWVEGAVGYQIFPERFGNGDPDNDHFGPETDEYHFRHPETGGTEPVLTGEWDGPVLDSHCCHQYFGGDLRGILDRLDYLDGLGVTVLYLNPIFSAGSVHGYDTFDYLEVAPNFGDTTLLRSLVEAADARGMRLIWDYVPNHVGIGHWAFRDAVEKGEASDYWDWFEFYVPADSIQAGNGNHYEAWWGFGSLPELQTREPAVMEHLLDVVEHWTAFGLDGIRVDVPNEIENRAEFFAAFRETAKGVDPDVYLVGEIWGVEPSWLRGTQFDAVMNYAIGEGVVERFARGDIGGSLAAREMAAVYAAYPEAAVAMMFNLVASHDTDRLLTKMGGGELGGTPSSDALHRQALAAAMLFALPGMPVTFQGDECAFLGGRDGRHTARYPYQWGSCDATMAAHYRALAELKRTVPALASPVIRGLGGSAALLSFYRGEPGPGEVLAVFNGSGAAASLELPPGSWTDLGDGGAVTGALSVPGPGWRYLRRD